MKTRQQKKTNKNVNQKKMLETKTKNKKKQKKNAPDRCKKNRKKTF